MTLKKHTMKLYLKSIYTLVSILSVSIATSGLATAKSIQTDDTTEGNRIVAVVKITQEREQEAAPESVEALASRVDPRLSIFSCCAFPPYCPSGARICSLFALEYIYEYI